MEKAERENLERLADRIERANADIPLFIDPSAAKAIRAALVSQSLQEVAEVRWASICGTNPPFISVSSLIPPDDLYDGMKLYARLEKKECP